MGPRRKLSLAIKEVKKQREEEEGIVGRGREEERRPKGDSRGSAVDGHTVRQSSRPQLVKQPSTELTAAYRQVRKEG